MRVPKPGANLTVKSIDVIGLSDQAREQLLAQLPVHVGDTMTAEAMPRIMLAVHQFDSHLSVGFNPDDNGDATLRISAPDSRPMFRTGVLGGIIAAAPASAGTAADSAPPQRIKVGGNVQAVNLLSGPKPVYPPEAKQAHISGTVELAAVIGKDGTIQNLTVVKGHPLLVQAALDAVKNWVYRPTLLNGNPVEVATTIDINYTLADDPPQQQQ